MTIPSNREATKIPDLDPCPCGHPACTHGQELYKEIQNLFKDETSAAFVGTCLTLVLAKLALAIFDNNRILAFEFLTENIGFTLSTIKDTSSHGQTTQ